MTLAIVLGVLAALAIVAFVARRPRGAVRRQVSFPVADEPTAIPVTIQSSADLCLTDGAGDPIVEVRAVGVDPDQLLALPVIFPRKSGRG